VSNTTIGPGVGVALSVDMGEVYDSQERTSIRLFGTRPKAGPCWSVASTVDTNSIAPATLQMTRPLVFLIVFIRFPFH